MKNSKKILQKFQKIEMDFRKRVCWGGKTAKIGPNDLPDWHALQTRCGARGCIGARYRTMPPYPVTG